MELSPFYFTVRKEHEELPQLPLQRQYGTAGHAIGIYFLQAVPYYRKLAINPTNNHGLSFPFIYYILYSEFYIFFNIFVSIFIYYILRKIFIHFVENSWKEMA